MESLCVYHPMAQLSKKNYLFAIIVWLFSIYLLSLQTNYLEKPTNMFYSSYRENGSKELKKEIYKPKTSTKIVKAREPYGLGCGNVHTFDQQQKKYSHAD